MARSQRASGACRERRLMSRYLDREMTRARCAEFEAHLRTCRSCAAIARRLRAALRTCRKTRGPKLPDDVRRRARARIKTLLGEET